MGIIKFNGISSGDLGLIVQFIPTYQFPEREYESVHIPGRNGDLLIDKGSFQNVERTYSIAKVYKQGENFVRSANSIVEWLSSATGYARLEDSYEPEYYREATFKMDGEMTNYYDTATAIEITFECKPQRWLKEGEKEISITTSGDMIKNPTGFDSHPIIKFTVAANTLPSITINGINIVFKESLTSATDVTIDCENMECYSQDSLLNSKITLTDGEFPILERNTDNTVEFSNLTNLKIIPRWWTL